MKDLYDYNFKYRFKKEDKVSWNRKIFNKCPFDIDEIKEVGEVPRLTPDFIGINGIRQWWNWWEIVPISKLKQIVYWIKFYPWYFMKFKKS